MKDTQDTRPAVEMGLERVGITNLKTPITTSWRGRSYYFLPTVEITIDLDRRRKGVHMSRLVEAITEAVEEGTMMKGVSIEGIQKRILERLGRRHPFRRGEIRMESDLVVYRQTPVSGRKTAESHRIEVAVVREGKRYSKKLKVIVLGNTVCPHSMITAGKPHIQRAIGELTVETSFSNTVGLEEMVECVEAAFSSRVYTLLKTEDEKRVVEDMFANPRFVEDVARSMLKNAGKRFKGCRIQSKAVSQESIHRHDVVAEGRIMT
jgi:GTP cyclohydrolase IV